MWRIFTTDSKGNYKGNTTTAADFNVKGAFANGWNFYYTAIGSGATDFYPASGYRASNSGSLYNVGAYGYSWSSAPASAAEVRGSFLYFFGNHMDPEGNYGRADCFPVRCVQE